MPERYSIFSDPDTLSKRFQVEMPGGYIANYNAAPTQLMPVITSDNPDGVSFFYWGLSPSWSKNKAISTKLINAPAENLATKPSYRKSLEKRRCLVLANGYFEWKQLGKKTKVPYYITLRSEEVFAMAGLWDEYEDENDDSIHTFSIITTPTLITKVGDPTRTPAVINKQSESIWLNEDTETDTLLDLLKPIPNDLLKSHSVSARINTINENSPELIKHAAPSDQFGNYTLFN